MHLRAVSEEEVLLSRGEEVLRVQFEAEHNFVPETFGARKEFFVTPHTRADASPNTTDRA